MIVFLPVNGSKYFLSVTKIRIKVHLDNGLKSHKTGVFETKNINLAKKYST
jgi:hypothetical protein